MTVFLSFLGLGSPVRKTADLPPVDHRYDPASYFFHGRPPGTPTPYVQRAILESLIADGNTPHLVLIAMTPASREWQWERPGRLRDTLMELEPLRAQGCVVEVDISEDLDVANQWVTFQSILERVPPRAELLVDLTHGFRAMPILFSAAVNFLTQAKQVTLAGAFYGAYEPRKPGPFRIVDMKDFFAVNRWAEAVRSVVEDANPALMAELAETERSLELSGLRDEALIRGLERLGSVLKNADTSNVAATADSVVSAVARALQYANPAAKLLLDLVLDKFQVLATEGGAERFSPSWYEVQLQMARVLLKHGLAMQGLTVLRELVVSWGEEITSRAVQDPGNAGRTLYLATHSEGKLRSTWIKNLRGRLGEFFFARLHVDERQWDPSVPGIDPDGAYARGFIDEAFRPLALRKEEGEFEFLKDLGNLRNVLNHGWTSREADHDDIGRRCGDYLDRVERLTHELIQAGVIGRSLADGNSALPGPPR